PRVRDVKAVGVRTKDVVGAVAIEVADCKILNRGVEFVDGLPPLARSSVLGRERHIPALGGRTKDIVGAITIEVAELQPSERGGRFIDLHPITPIYAVS